MPAGDPAPPSSPPQRQVYRRRHRLTHAREFDAVYQAKVRKSRGPLVVFVRPNGLPYARLGLSVGRRIGPAVVRNRVKRLLREAFRLGGGSASEPHRGPSLPGGYDIIVNVRPHDAKAARLIVYQELLIKLAREAAREWERRDRKAEPPAAGGRAELDTEASEREGAADGQP